uniref:Uncharacterized protein n=1 Tax=Panagrolaimus superbus TaxID=310955 RepID=A0A914Z208_9BILA
MAGSNFLANVERLQADASLRTNPVRRCNTSRGRGVHEHVADRPFGKDVSTAKERATPQGRTRGRPRGRPRSRASLGAASNTTRGTLKRRVAFSEAANADDDEEELSTASESQSKLSKKTKLNKSAAKPRAKKSLRFNPTATNMDDSDDVHSENEHLFDDFDSENLEVADRFFVGKSAACVFAANDLDITAGTVSVNASVVLPVYGMSRVIYDKIEDEDVAIEKAKEYAEGTGKKYGRSDGKYIVFISKPAAPCNHDEQICALEDENVALRVRMEKQEEETAHLKIMVQQQQRMLDRILAGQNPGVHLQGPEGDAASLSASNQTASTGDRNPVSSSTSSNTNITLTLQSLTDAPKWEFIDEQSVAVLYRQHSDPKAFIRALYKSVFTDYDTFLQVLPPAKSVDVIKICMLFLSAVNETTQKNVFGQFHTEWRYQKKLLRNKIIAPQSATAVAMIDKAIPLRKEGALYVPDEDHGQF